MSQLLDPQTRALLTAQRAALLEVQATVDEQLVHVDNRLAADRAELVRLSKEVTVPSETGDSP